MFTKICILGLAGCLSVGSSVGSGHAADCGSAPLIGRSADITILTEGDSITAGDGATDGLGSYVDRSSLSSDPRVRLLNRSKHGAILGVPTDTLPGNSLYARLQSDNAVLRNRRPGDVYILTILIGRNDLVNYGNVPDYLFNLGRYAATLKRAGWDRVILGTLLPSDWAPFRSLRTDWNAAVQANCWAERNGIDAIAPFGEMPEMGSDAAAAATTYFADGTHPNNSGYRAMAVVFARTVDKLRAGT